MILDEATLAAIVINWIVKLRLVKFGWSVREEKGVNNRMEFMIKPKRAFYSRFTL